MIPLNHFFSDRKDTLPMKKKWAGAQAPKASLPLVHTLVSSTSLNVLTTNKNTLLPERRMTATVFVCLKKWLAES